MKIIKLSFLILTISCLTFPVFAQNPALILKKDEVIKVGIFENKPMCYTDANGKKAGIFVSVIEYTAAQEGWKLEYVEGNWKKLRTKLGKGEIDVLLSMAVSRGRAKLYTFNKVDVFTNWGEIYVRPESNINSLLDLKGKQIASLENSIYTTGPEGIINISNWFNLDCKIINVDTYTLALKAVKDKQADAGIVNRLVGALNKKEFGLKKSGIVFAPVKIRFALNKESSKTRPIAKALDHYMTILRMDGQSIYHQTIAKALGGPTSVVEVLPKWIKFSLFICAGLILIFLFIFLFMRWQVRKKTLELYTANKQLKIDIIKRNKIERSLRESENQLKKMIEKSPLPMVITNLNQDILFFNNKFIESFGYTLEDISTAEEWWWTAYPDKEYRARVQDSWVKAIEKAEANKTDIEMQKWELTIKDGTKRSCEFYMVPLADVSLIVMKDITDHQQAEKEIKNHAENLKIIFNSTPNILVLVNDESRVEMINNSGAAFLGKKKEELLGRLGGEVFNCLNSFSGQGCGRNPDCSQCPVRTRIISTFQYGKPHTEEEGHMTFQLNGEDMLMDLLISTTLVRLNGTKNVLLSLTDITKRKKVEKELKRRNSIEAGLTKVSNLFVSSNQVDYDRILQILGEKIIVDRAYIFQIHDDGSKLSNTFEWCAPGTSPQKNTLQNLETSMFPWWMIEMMGKRNIIIKNVDELPPEANAEKKILQEQEIFSLVVIPIWLKGKTFWGFMGFDDTKTTRNWSDPEVDALKIVGEMISGDIERRASENKREVEREQYLSIFDNIDEIIYVSDVDTYEILYVNHSLRKSFPKEIIGKTCYKVLQGFESPCDFCTNDIILEQKPEPYSWDYHNPILNRDFNIIDRIIKWPDGRNVRFEFARDITEKILSEKKFENLQEQIVQSQKMESIGTLAGGIAHDFNNILFPILGHSEMLLEDISDDDQLKPSVGEIYSGALRAKELVQQILTFSRQEKSEMKLMKIQSILKEVLKMIRSTIPTTINILQNIETKCGAVKADPTQIHQVIMNLTTNAYHAMEETGGTMEVHLKQIELKKLDLINPNMAPGLYACLTVKDTGKGMVKELTEKIFDPFFTTKDNGKGTGMGLSVVHGIVNGMKGAIQVYSKPGEGTVFHVYFPIEKHFFDSDHIHSKKKILSGKESILLVDDEKAIITMEKQMLERLGYQVISSTSSIDALATFRDNPDKFDLVITDMAMPNLPGDKLAAELTKIRPDVPILLCTGFSESISEQKAALMGIKGLLLKPIVMRDLAQRIREVVEK